MRVLLLAPNAGVSLSTGGGSNFVLKQAKALAGLGHSVVLAGYHALTLPELESVHGVDLSGVRDRVRVESAGGDRGYRAHRQLPGKPSPYVVLLDPRVRSWLAALDDRVRPDLVWFHDDVPVPAVPWARRTRCRLYVHYPLLGRSARLVPPLRRSRGPGEAVQDAMLRRAAERLVEPRPADLVEAIEVNSSVTQRVVRAVWGGSPVVVPTYARTVPAPPADRGREVVSLAAFHRGKGLELLVDGFRRVGAPGAHLTMIGQPRDASELARLRRAARGAPVSFVPGATREEVDRALGAARAVLGGAEFEPFGLAVLEGMASGATPVLRASEYSGAWTDLAERGRTGRGFRTAAELGGILRGLLDPPSAAPDAAARARADRYDEATFVDAMRRAAG